jgi:glycosyltransferase involved in cell wall biosynthesis
MSSTELRSARGHRLHVRNFFTPQNAGSTFFRNVGVNPRHSRNTEVYLLINAYLVSLKTFSLVDWNALFLWRCWTVVRILCFLMLLKVDFLLWYDIDICYGCKYLSCLCLKSCRIIDRFICRFKKNSSKNAKGMAYIFATLDLNNFWNITKPRTK